MKKTLPIIALALAFASSAACAAEAEPVYSWSWSAEDGATINADGWSDFGYTEGNDYALFGSGYQVWKTGITECSGSFTLSMDIRRPSTSTAWRNLISLYTNNGASATSPYLALQFNGAGEIYLYESGSFDSSSAASASIATGISAASLATDEWTNISIVSDLTEQTLSVYVDGTLVGSVSDWNAEYGLTGVQFGKGFGAGNRVWDGTMQVNNLAIYSEAVHAIPEPATATLSLLALAGLAARRRRK